ncbi:MAG: mechanosensitive ion channel family protein [bacterium]|nr:mechanosensitive ion channel family protein [bacterium]
MDFSLFFNDLIEPWFFEHGFRLIFLVVALFIAQRIARIAIRKSVQGYTKHAYKLRDGKAQEKREETLAGVFLSAVGVVIWVIGGIMILSELGVNTGPLIAGAGIVGIAFGFGGQWLIKDIIAGFFIILEDQYRKGDIVKIAGIAGEVTGVNLRHTILRDLDGTEHHVPNGSISIASNLTKFSSRANIDISIAYKENVDEVMEVLNHVGKEMAEDEAWKSKFIKPISVLGIQDFADSAVVIKVLGETKAGEQWAISREFRRRVKNTFDEKGIEIPFPHRVVFTRNE